MDSHGFSGLQLESVDLKGQLISGVSIVRDSKVDKKLLRPKDIKFQVPDSSKFIKQTNWKQKYKVDESLDYLLKECRERFEFNLNK